MANLEQQVSQMQQLTAQLGSQQQELGNTRASLEQQTQATNAALSVAQAAIAQLTASNQLRVPPDEGWGGPRCRSQNAGDGGGGGCRAEAGGDFTRKCAAMQTGRHRAGGGRQVRRRGRRIPPWIGEGHSPRSAGAAARRRAATFIAGPASSPSPRSEPWAAPRWQEHAGADECDGAEPPLGDLLADARGAENVPPSRLPVPPSRLPAP